MTQEDKDKICRLCSSYDGCGFISRNLQSKCYIMDMAEEVYEYERSLLKLWKDAQGDDLPDYDREVVVLIQDYPDCKEHLRVAYGHRPNPNGLTTTDGERIYPMTYDSGGWNLRDIRWWLDLKLPNEIEL